MSSASESCPPPSPIPDRKRPRDPPPQSPAATIDFEFLNFSHPSDAKAKEARRTVRSHVTKKQHMTQAAVKRSRTDGGPPARADSASESPKAPSLRVAHSSSASNPSDAADSPAVPRELAIKAEVKSESNSATPPDLSEPPTPSRVDSVFAGGRSAQAMQLDPYQIYSMDWHPFVQPILEHYLSLLAPDIASTKVLQQLWLPFVRSELSLLDAVMLFAATHYSCSPAGRDAGNLDTNALRDRAISGLNKRISDSRSVTDVLICTAVHLAAFEALFGDADAYTMHMTGLQRLVQHRGGMERLGVNGLLEKALLWLDSNASRATGMRPFFAPDAAGNPKPSPDKFGGRRSPRDGGRR